MFSRTRPGFTVEIRRRRVPTPSGAEPHPGPHRPWPEASLAEPGPGQDSHPRLDLADPDAPGSGGGGSAGPPARRTGRILPSLLTPTVQDEAASADAAAASPPTPREAARDKGGAGAPKVGGKDGRATRTRKGSTGEVQAGPGRTGGGLIHAPAELIAADTAPPTEAAAPEQARPRPRRWAGRRGEPVLKAGERWKRRLPRSLR